MIISHDNAGRLASGIERWTHTHLDLKSLLLGKKAPAHTPCSQASSGWCTLCSPVIHSSSVCQLPDNFFFWTGTKQWMHTFSYLESSLISTPALVIGRNVVHSCHTRTQAHTHTRTDARTRARTHNHTIAHISCVRTSSCTCARTTNDACCLPLPGGRKHSMKC